NAHAVAGDADDVRDGQGVAVQREGGWHARGSYVRRCETPSFLGQWAAQFKTPSRKRLTESRVARELNLATHTWEPLAAWRLVMLPRDCYLPPGQPRPFRRHQVRIPGSRLHAPIEDHVLAADVRHSQRSVVQHGSVYEFEDVAKTGAREERIPAVPARRREVDRGEISDGIRAVELSARPREHWHDPERRVRSVDVNNEIDVAPGAAPHQSELPGIAVAIAVQVVPKAKARLCIVRAAQ